MWCYTPHKPAAVGFWLERPHEEARPAVPAAEDMAEGQDVEANCVNVNLVTHCAPAAAGYRLDGPHEAARPAVAAAEGAAAAPPSTAAAEPETVVDSAGHRFNPVRVANRE